MSLYPSAVEGIVMPTRVSLRFASLSPMPLSVFFKEIYRLFNLFNGVQWSDLHNDTTSQW